jgi:hypothetical protein
MLRSWVTSLFGILSIVVALVHCFSAGKLDIICVMAILQGAGLIAAKDHNVTGGTKS